MKFESFDGNYWAPVPLSLLPLWVKNLIKTKNLKQIMWEDEDGLRFSLDVEPPEEL